MALEDAINNLANAINRYTDQLGGAPTDARPLEEVVADVVKQESTAKKASSSAKSAESKPAEASTATTASTTTSPSKEDNIDVNELKAKFSTIVQKDTPKAKEILTEMGFPKFGLIPANLHAKLQTLTDAALETLGD